MNLDLVGILLRLVHLACFCVFGKLRGGLGFFDIQWDRPCMRLMMPCGVSA